MKISGNSLCLATLLLLVLLTVHSEAQLVDASLPIEMTADATGADARTGKVTFTNISIRQGPLSIVADSAESSTLGFDDSTWTFRGRVKLTAPASSLNASRMTLRFVNKRIERAILAGAPLAYTDNTNDGTRVTARTADVTFSRNAIATVELSGAPIELSRGATFDRKRMEGKANAMTYSAITNNLQLTGEAELGEGANRITGNQITYNLETRQVLAAANEQGDKRVHITIIPTEDDSIVLPESEDEATASPESKDEATTSPESEDAAENGEQNNKPPEPEEPPSNE